MADPLQGPESTLVFYVNGKKVVEPHADPETTLLQYLRNTLGLTGTKLGCAEGGCGACTVMVSSYDRKQNKVKHISVNACLAPVCSMHGLAVTTVEGIGSTRTALHPIQERLAKSHGSQCGFCTPGIVMSMYALLRNNPLPSRKQMEEAFEGNLCRCTGYRPILDGFNTFTKEFTCGMGDQCCRNKKQDQQETAKPTPDSSFLPYDPSQEPIFPSELQLNAEYDSAKLTFRGERSVWYRPNTLDELAELKAQYPQAKLVIGNTEIGVEVKFKNQVYPVLIAPTNIPELKAVEQLDTGIKFGASVTLATLEHVLAEASSSLPDYKTRVFAAILEMLRWFAGQQIRNVGSIGGNIITASPISDLNPIFLAARCLLTLTSKGGGQRIITMDENFFSGYRKTAVRPDEVLVSIHIPYTHENEYFAGYKQAHRREDDISIVNAGMRVEFKAGTSVIENISLAYGGMAPFTVMALGTMKSVVGKKWEKDLIEGACQKLEKDLPLPAGTPGGMETYRRSLTTSFFFKFFLTVQKQLHATNPDAVQAVPTKYDSATAVYSREASKGVQVYEEVSPDQSADDGVGRSLLHQSADKQTTGEAIYCDDIPQYKNELYLCPVFTTCARGRIVSVDTSAALAEPGVVQYMDHKDVPGVNMTGGGSPYDEEIFVKEEVHTQGQVLGVIVADTQTHAQQAARKVEVVYEKQEPIITLEQAIEAKSFIAPGVTIEKGDVEGAMAACDHVIEGEGRIGGQEHFYLETQATIAIPKEGEMEIFCSTQNPTMAQFCVASALGVAANHVVVRTKRMGGGFGGKESRFICPLLYCAVAANKLGCPVRCMLDRDEDMVNTGTRHPFLAKYKVGFTSEGLMKAVKVTIYSNAGYSRDLSGPVLERALVHLDNAYLIPNFCATGYMCRTNLPSNTAFRGFGGPQGMFMTEMWITHVAHKLGKTPEQIREINMYREGDLTHYNQKLINDNNRKCWEAVMNNINIETCRARIKEFNSQNRWKKRGLSVVPVKFGISFTALFLNQAGALVHVYKDGSVLLAHGGTEMGQGLHVKMMQVASRVLPVPVSKIHIIETNTTTVPNTSPTAASASSDLNGMAIKEACEAILKRLQPYITKDPSGTWEKWVLAAYFDRVCLSSTGFYSTPGLGHNWTTNEGDFFAYFTYGSACSEVEIDCLTGDHTVLRTDIVMDVGQSLNPAIDIGQIEGGFMQGYGLFTLEDIRYSPEGFLYTRGPGAYKIPGFGDIPIEFNVSLLKGASNPRAVYSSKAIGEPPLFLAASVFFAIYDALQAARAESGLTQFFKLDSPATAERIRMACVDQFTKQFPESEPGSYKPWSVVP